jgi:spermidine synthase
MNRRAFYPEIFLVSFVALLLEISYTRVFSFKVSSYYTYLILGLALLGTGGGGVFVALSPKWREVPTRRLLALLSVAGAAAIAVGYLIIASLELNTLRAALSFSQISRLAIVCLVLFAAFLTIGLMIAIIFTNRPSHIHRLYFSDLAGAGLGCAAAIPMMDLFSPPGCIFVGAAALAAGGLRNAFEESRRVGVVVAAFALLLALGAVLSPALPDPVVDPGKTMGRDQLERWGFTPIFREWNAVFRVDVLESPLLPTQRALVHDGDWGSALHAFDGEISALADRYEASSRALPFAVGNESPRVLVLGSAGGNEILASLYFGAEKITGVELNPVTVSLLTDHMADFTGHLTADERVTLVNAEGRAFMKRDRSKYDIIYFVAPDSYASMNAAQASGFVLVESYLYTKEMLKEAIDHLAPGGIISMQFGEVHYGRKPNRTTRYLATAREALDEIGITAFARHVLLATNKDFPLQLSTILIQATPFSESQIEAFMSTIATIPDSSARHAWGRELDQAPPNAVITLPSGELEAFFESYPYRIGPVSDDSPFFWHFVRFRDLLAGDNPALRVRIGPEDGRGETALLAMALVASVFSVVTLLLPFAVVRDRWSQLPDKGRTVVFFASLGLGFMLFEVALIQKLTLFLGYPTYALTVTLALLLVFAGIGSATTGWYLEARDRALPLLAALVVLLSFFYAFGLDAVVAAFVGEPLGLRIGVTAIVLAPLGLGLGAFMPLGLATVARSTQYSSEYVAWGWAINGVFSVVGSIVATMLSMSLGFRVVLISAACLYVLAAGLLLWVPLRRVEAGAPGTSAVE